MEFYLKNPTPIGVSIEGNRTAVPMHPVHGGWPRQEAVTPPTSNSNRQEILRRFTSESGVGGEDGVQVSKERIGLAVEAAGKLVAVESELEHLPY